uniref:Uncharacterized protein n=1 Tax=Tanacetum cinerariifolium TaxID=118510 RepID=A0A6L2JYP3_TANCI|nr:hypothetical protein [Tanacetum cinerariifolium]
MDYGSNSEAEDGSDNGCLDYGSDSKAEDGSNNSMVVDEGEQDFTNPTDHVRAQGSDGELFQAEEMVVALRDDQTHDRRTVFMFCLMLLDLSLNFENEYVALTVAQLEYGGNAIDLAYMFNINATCDQVEFKRISLTGFHSCTRRSRYRSVSKQTTR